MSTSKPIRIFVGCSANNEDLESQLVLDYALRKYASQPIEIEWMQLSRDPDSFWHGWNNAQWATPFSGFRWGIPARCNFEGRAIYMDSDMMPRADFAELWNEDIPADKVCVSRGDGVHFCVTLFDCAKAKQIATPLDQLKSSPGAYREQRGAYAKRTKPFATGQWNYLDTDNLALTDPSIKCIHYTSIPTQPQLKYALPRLEKEGIKHWYKGSVHTHWRGDIPKLFDELYAEARTAASASRRQHGLFDPLDKYRVAPYGDYGVGSQGGGLATTKSAAEARKLLTK